jgi:NAD(P)-dependent dehydrogenase (short-subunit alcohol dehydrogenase family)
VKISEKIGEKMDILISGASTGIGRAAAIHFARLGHTVWAGVRGEQAAGIIEKLNVRGLQPIQLDVTKSDSITEAVHLIKKKSGMLHALINNAGIVVSGPIELLTIARWREQFDVNFFGMLELTAACLPSLRESKGRIVNMSSISGRIASPFLAPYATSKFALEAYSDSLRRELAPHQVRVSVIEPGPIDTPIWRKSTATNTAAFREYPEEITKLYEVPLQKFKRDMEKAELGAAPVALVLKALQHALLAKSPRTRYPVGRGIGIASQAAAILPDSWLDRLF